MHPSEHAKNTPDKPAYIMALSGVVVTYAELDERASAVRVVERFGAATLGRAIFNSNEFLYLD